MDPVSYPKICIAGIDYEVKFRQWDIIALSKDGVNLFAMPKLALLDPEAFERSNLILKHAIAHQVDLTVEEIGKGLDLGQAGEVDQILAEAIKKAQSQIMASLPKLEAVPQP